MLPLDSGLGGGSGGARQRLAAALRRRRGCCKRLCQRQQETRHADGGAGDRGDATEEREEAPLG